MRHFPTKHGSLRVFLAVLWGLALLAATGASAGVLGPDFSKTFSPATIGPGSVSTLTFTIDNSANSTPLTELAFTDVLPAGVTLAAPASPVSLCGGTLTAPDGGSTITLTDGTVGGFAICTIRVDATSSTPGTHMNVSGALTSTLGDAGVATADLTVATDRPGFSKSFSPGTVFLGGRSTLTFLIDNTLNPAQAVNMTFTDTLPTGVEVAGPANIVNTCDDGAFTGGVVTAVPGSSSISLGFGGGIDAAAVAAGGTCTISVDVVATGLGALENTSGELSANVSNVIRSGGKAAATLNSIAAELLLIKEFTDDPVPPGGTVTLEFTIVNRVRDTPVTDLSFSDNLGDAGGTLTGLAAVPPLPTDPCGSGSALTGTTTLSLTGGNLPGGGSCTFQVTLQVPLAATPGIYPNTTTPLLGDLGEIFLGNAASDDLFVFAAPLLTKTFLDDPVAAGDSTRMEFTITNTSPTSVATDITFLDDLTAFLPFPISATLPAPGFCGGGSSISLIGLGTEQQGLLMTGGSLAAADSCTFEVVLDLPATLAAGIYTNVTGEITATVDGETLTGSPASATVEVVGGVRLIKELTDDPVLPGGLVTLQLMLTHDPNALTDATGITFTDDLDAALTGLVAVGLPQNDVCGAGSQIDGMGSLTFTGGTLAPGASCQFSVTLQVPMGALAGTYPNTTSDATATVSGLEVVTPGGADDLTVAGLGLAKEFTDDPVIPGGSVTLQFTLTNESGAPAASNIAFQDDLSAVAAGLTYDPGSIPMTPCGVSSSITLQSANRRLVFAGGSLGPGEMCQFSVTVNVGAGVPSDVYVNRTSLFSAVIDGNLLVLGNAVDNLIVAGDVLLLTKTFLTNPVGPGATVDLEFELTNLSLAGTATGITFTDNLGAALTGLQAITLPANGFCGAGSQLTGMGVLTLTGAELGPGASCIFTVTVQVPAMPAASMAINTTSQVTGTIGALGVTGDPASDTLEIQSLDFTKSFDGPTVAGGTVVLTFTIDNLVDGAVADLAFTDDLDAVLSGLVATGLPLVDVCGVGSSVNGTSFLTFSGGSLGPSASCSFNVTLQVPAAAAEGTFPNTTSALFSAGLEVAEPATASLEVEPPPTFAKVFAPDVIATTGASTLTFTVDNGASAVAATDLDFTDNLPAGVVVANPSNASTTCTGGTLTATSGSGVITYTGGTVSALSFCAVSVDVTSDTAGIYDNTTGDLTSASGNSGMAMATLTVEPPPTFAKVFVPDAIAATGISTLVFTIDNGASVLAATALDFTDNLPAAVVVASPSNGSTTCTGGTLTAVSGTGVITYTGGTVPALASCTVSVDVTSDTSGSHVNTTGELTSSSGSSGTAMATLLVDPPPDFSKSFDPANVSRGQVTTLTFVIDNTASSMDATGLDFTDFLPSGMTIADPANATTDCVGGTLTANPGDTVIQYTNGAVSALSLCTVSVDVVTILLGDNVNTTEALSSSLGDSGTATGVLAVGIATPQIPTLGGWGLILLALGLALAAVWKMSRS